MDHRLIEGLMEAVVPLICDHVDELVAAATAPLLLRLAEVENRKVEKQEIDNDLILRMVEETVAKLPPAIPGKDADPEMVAELVSKAVAALEPPKDGAPGPAGQDGKDADPVVVANLLVDLMPIPEPGKDGAPGEPGKSLSVEDLAPVIEEIVAKRVAEMPPAKDGADGKEGQPGRDGRDGLPGVQGEKGLDGRNGVDGKDGFGIDDFSFRSDDEGRTLILELSSEDREPIIQEVKTSIVLDRGVWREGAFKKGDSVTWAGSSFIAQRDTTDKPETSDAWRLAVKRGRDGKEGRPGPQGEKGLKGDPGTPGRNY